MSIRSFLMGLALVAVLLPSDVYAAALYGGGDAIALNAGVNIDVGASVGGDAGTSTPSDSSAGDDATIDTTGTTTAHVQIFSAAEVKTEADLQVYEESLTAQNESVATIESTDERVEVAYYHPGHLFGFIPVKVKSSTVIETNADGMLSVKTHMPWWNLFVTGTEDVTTEVNAALSSASIETDMKLVTDASARARIIEAAAAAHADATASLNP